MSMNLIDLMRVFRERARRCAAVVRLGEHFVTTRGVTDQSQDGSGFVDRLDYAFARRRVLQSPMMDVRRVRAAGVSRTRAAPRPAEHLILTAVASKPPSSHQNPRARSSSRNRRAPVSPLSTSRRAQLGS